MMHIFYSFVQIVTVTKIISCINLIKAPLQGAWGAIGRMTPESVLKPEL